MRGGHPGPQCVRHSGRQQSRHRNDTKRAIRYYSSSALELPRSKRSRIAECPACDGCTGNALQPSVYYVNGVELISSINRLNEGFSWDGKSRKASTGFVIGCTFKSEREKSRRAGEWAGAQGRRGYEVCHEVTGLRCASRGRNGAAHRRHPDPDVHRRVATDEQAHGRMFPQRSPWHGCSRRCACGDGRS